MPLRISCCGQPSERVVVWAVSTMDAPNPFGPQQRQERDLASAVAIIVSEIQLKVNANSLPVSGSLLFASVLPLGFRMAPRVWCPSPYCAFTLSQKIAEQKGYSYRDGETA